MITTNVAPTSVGEMLKEEFLQPLGLNQTDLAKATGLSRKTINQICLDKSALTPETASLLAAALGTTVEFWLNLQLANDVYAAKHSEALLSRVNHVQSLVKMDIGVTNLCCA